MNRSEGYRRQSHDTRVAARAHLRQLREERLARRGAGKEQRPAPAEGAGPDAAQAPQLSVSRAASEAISEWSRREAGADRPAEGLDDGPAPQPVGHAGVTPGEAMPTAASARGGQEAGTSDAAFPSDGPAQQAVSGQVAGSPGGPDRPERAQGVPGVEVGMQEAGEAPSSGDATSGTADDAVAAGSEAPSGDAPAQEAPSDGVAAEMVPCADGRVPADTGHAAPPGAEGGPGDAPDDGPDDGPDQAPPAAESDLHALPGAGIGLVWMLQRCGVSSLADLAAADADRLRREMGLVGELLDLSGWIAFARDAVAQAPPARH